MHPSELGSEGDLNDLERRIAGWRPAPGGLDRDRLMFEAGRASARAGRWERAGSAMLACLALGLGVLLVQERALRRPMERMSGAMAGVPGAPRQADLPSPVSAPDPDSYLVLTRRLLASAPESLPAAPDSRAAGQSEPTLTPLRARGSDINL